MDPNAAHARIRELTDRMRGQQLPGDVAELMMLYDDLDKWLGRGGFLPRAWDRIRRTCGGHREIRDNDKAPWG